MILHKRFRLFKNQKGLTLIELLAVVVVLGIIAAIAVPAISGTIESQKGKADESSKDIIAEAAQRYFYDIDPHGESVDLSDEATVTIATLKTDGYLNASFTATLQYDSSAYFNEVTGSYSSGGWIIDPDTDVATATQ